MKVREGFVSNSSSSSFIIGVKGELTVDKLVDALGVPKGTPLYGFATDMAKFIVQEVSNEDMEEIIKEYTDYGDKIPENWQKVIDKGFTLYRGSASYNEGDGVELALGNMDIECENDNIIFFTERY